MSGPEYASNKAAQYRAGSSREDPKLSDHAFMLRGRRVPIRSLQKERMACAQTLGDDSRHERRTALVVVT